MSHTRQAGGAGAPLIQRPEQPVGWGAWSAAALGGPRTLADAINLQSAQRGGRGEQADADQAVPGVDAQQARADQREQAASSAG